LEIITMALSPEARELLKELEARTAPSLLIAEQAKRHTQDLERKNGATFTEIERNNEQLRTEMAEIRAHVALPTASDGSPLTGRRQLAAEIARHPALLEMRNDSEGTASPVRFEVPLRAAISNDPASAGQIAVSQSVPGIYGPGVIPLTLRDVLPKLPARGNAVEYLREMAGADIEAGVQSEELTLKKESSLEFEAIEAPVIGLSHQIKASKQILADVIGLQNHIGARLLHGLGEKDEAQMLYGSGVGENLQGFMPLAPRAPLYGYSMNPHVTNVAWTPPGSTVAISVKNYTSIDAVRLAKLAVQLSGFEPTAVCLSPFDIAQMELEKVDVDAYLMQVPGVGQIGPGLNGKILTLWQLPVVVCHSLQAGDFLIGDFIRGATIFQREQATLELGYSVEEGDFTRNALRLKAEERLALAIYAPAAFRAGKF
jgi:HK97 family phage major capsid protein